MSCPVWTISRCRCLWGMLSSEAVKVVLNKVGTTNFHSLMHFVSCDFIQKLIHPFMNSMHVRGTHTGMANMTMERRHLGSLLVNTVAAELQPQRFDFPFIFFEDRYRGKFRNSDVMMSH